MDSVPVAIKADMERFVFEAEKEAVDLEQLGIRGIKMDQVIKQLKEAYGV